MYKDHFVRIEQNFALIRCCKTHTYLISNIYIFIMIIVKYICIINDMMIL